MFLLAGDLALSHTGAVAAMQSDSQVHGRYEVQHSDSSPEAATQTYHVWGHPVAICSKVSPCLLSDSLELLQMESDFLSLVNQEQ